MATTVIAYIPAIHQGYIKLFEQYPDKLLVLGGEFIQEAPRMERDIRAVRPAAIAKMVAALGVMQQVAVLEDVSGLGQLEGTKVVMPDEELSRLFAVKHLKGRKVEFIPTFLRWERQISTTEFEVPPDRIISTDELHKEIMIQAEHEAVKSADWWRQIGAVLVKDDLVLLTGRNKPLMAEDYTVNVFGDPRSNFDAGEYIEFAKTIHAESGLIAEAAKRGIALEGAAMYVTTFPCPVCAKLIAAAGITRVYYSKGYSLLDAEDLLKAHNIEVVLVDMKSPLPRAGRGRIYVAGNDPA